MFCGDPDSTSAEDRRIADGSGVGCANYGGSSAASPGNRVAAAVCGARVGWRELEAFAVTPQDHQHTVAWLVR